MATASRASQPTAARSAFPISPCPLLGSFPLGSFPLGSCPLGSCPLGWRKQRSHASWSAHGRWAARPSQPRRLSSALVACLFLRLFACIVSVFVCFFPCLFVLCLCLFASAARRASCAPRRTACGVARRHCHGVWREVRSGPVPTRHTHCAFQCSGTRSAIAWRGVLLGKQF